VLELSLECSHTVAAAPPAGDLFAGLGGPRGADASAATADGLARLVERLQARLGTAQVQCLAPVADYRPEHGTQWQPADPARLGRQGLPPAQAAALSRALGSQPLWLLPAPQPLPERELRPLLDGRPLTLLAGPERLECHWWDTDTGPALRDYFIAQAAGGALVWVYRLRLPPAADAPGWFLHGWFA
jgi:protein ImuB